MCLPRNKSKLTVRFVLGLAGMIAEQDFGQNIPNMEGSIACLAQTFARSKAAAIHQKTWL